MLKTDVENAISAGIAFLGKSRTQMGLWEDFPAAGWSDEWVTAYTGAILSGSGNEAAIALSREAWDSFAARHWLSGHGGWAYSSRFPEDADSTAWGIKFALNLGLADKARTAMAVQFLQKHIGSDGGIATYLEAVAFKTLHRKHPGYDFSGWTSSHPCTTAAASVIPAFNEALIPYLVKNQLSDGGWEAYWTSDRVYTTTYAVQALLMHSQERHRAAVTRAIAWVMEQFGRKSYIATPCFPGGSDFATALGVRTLILAGDSNAMPVKIPEVINRLVVTQKEEGSWAPSTLLLIPEPFVKPTLADQPASDLRRSNPYMEKTDRYGIFTTATVLECLFLFTHIINNQNFINNGKF